MALAIVKNGMLLMGRRKDNGKWTNPGGHANDGEAPIDAGIREAKEETGLDLTQDRLYHLDTQIIHKPSGEKLKIVAYKVNLDEGATTIKNDPDDEVHRWVWVNIKPPLNRKIFDNLHVPKNNVIFDSLGVTMEKNAFFVGFEKAAKEMVRGGLADGKPASKYPADQIEKGIKVEFEHTNDRDLAREIAKDHLEENKNYYTHLEKMEREMDKKGESVEDLFVRKNKLGRHYNDASGDSHILAEADTIRE